MAAGHSVDLAGWREMFDELMWLVAGRFARVEPRRTARQFVAGLLSPVERKNCWWLAGQAGHGDPQAMQRLLRTTVWDADEVRDDLRTFVAAQLGDPRGVLICDETGFLKKGTASVGVQRKYSGTAGRIENSQLGVFLSYASPRGRALTGRRVCLPRGDVRLVEFGDGAECGRDSWPWRFMISHWSPRVQPLMPPLPPFRLTT